MTQIQQLRQRKKTILGGTARPQPDRFVVAVVNTAAKPPQIVARAVIWTTEDSAAQRAREWVADSEERRDHINRSQMTIACHNLRTKQPVKVPQHRVGTAAGRRPVPTEKNLSL